MKVKWFLQPPRRAAARVHRADLAALPKRIGSAPALFKGAALEYQMKESC